MAEYPIETKTVPTFYFVGVTTGNSSINTVFPLWMQEFGRPDVVLEGVDLPLHAAPEAYQRVVAQIKHDPLSLGALVTTHKIDLFEAAQGMFDWFDRDAEHTREVSCIAKRGGRLEGYAKDPLTAGLSLEHLIGAGYFGRTGGHVLLLGAGGAASATLLYLLNQPHAADRPAQITIVDRDPSRLARLRGLAEAAKHRIPCEWIANEDPRRNDARMEAMPEGSLVINATGMGKDTPGSPLTDAGRFPRKGVAWEFNYRGELDFLHQARRQARERQLKVEDGWVYFLHGWSQVIGQVLGVAITPELFARLDRAAAGVRG